MMKSGIGESITKAQKEVGDCGTGAETPKDTRSGRTKCTRSHVTSQPKLQDKNTRFGKLVGRRLVPADPTCFNLADACIPISSILGVAN